MHNKDEKINVGVGFVTGRKSFKKVLNTYIYRWKEASSEIKKQANLHLFVAYDLDYLNTNIGDYVNVQKDVMAHLDSALFIGQSMIDREFENLVNKGVLAVEEAALVFGKGYAGKRNSVLYFALKYGMDYLVFLDDDEYPLAVTRTGHSALWSGQNVLTDHLHYLKDADITNGYHCGYISPIPYMQFDKSLQESDFQLFIEAISNDILSWDSMKEIIRNGGVTYAQPQILVNNTALEVAEVNNAKFISGSNLGINLTKHDKIKPFFNPPGARGEDTFLSTCLRRHKLLRIPCYTFHDGFSAYVHLLDGVLPIDLKHINADNEGVKKRFYRACLGWVRYKPLYLYITKPQEFERDVAEVLSKLTKCASGMKTYFNDRQFTKIVSEFMHFTKHVQNHYKLFLDNQVAWEKCINFVLGSPVNPTV